MLIRIFRDTNFVFLLVFRKFSRFLIREIKSLQKFILIRWLASVFVLYITLFFFQPHQVHLELTTIRTLVTLNPSMAFFVWLLKLQQIIQRSWASRCQGFSAWILRYGTVSAHLTCQYITTDKVWGRLDKFKKSYKRLQF